MKNICFIGAFDKLDFILCIAKIITNLDKKVLIVDATDLQKSRYIVPTINPTKSYVTSFSGIDIAIGFESYEEIERYLGDTECQVMKYDYVLVDIDKGGIFSNFNNENTIKNYFVTSYDLYSIKKGLAAIKQIEKPVQITKVIFSRELNIEDEYYLDYLALGHKIVWDDNKINFPYETQDLEAMMENQKTSKIRLKGLTQQYKDNLEYILTDMLPEVNITNLRKIMKNMEKEG